MVFMEQVQQGVRCWLHKAHTIIEASEERREEVSASQGKQAVQCAPLHQAANQAANAGAHQAASDTEAHKNSDRRSDQKANPNANFRPHHTGAHAYAHSSINKTANGAPDDRYSCSDTDANSFAHSFPVRTGHSCAVRTGLPGRRLAAVGSVQRSLQWRYRTARAQGDR
jgi:hypothetical protein